MRQQEKESGMDNKEKKEGSNMPSIHEGVRSDEDEGRKVKSGCGGRDKTGGCEQGERDRMRKREGWMYRDWRWLIGLHQGWR